MPDWTVSILHPHVRYFQQNLGVFASVHGVLQCLPKLCSKVIPADAATSELSMHTAAAFTPWAHDPAVVRLFYSSKAIWTSTCMYFALPLTWSDFSVKWIKQHSLGICCLQLSSMHKLWDALKHGRDFLPIALHPVAYIESFDLRMHGNLQGLEWVLVTKLEKLVSLRCTVVRMLLVNFWVAEEQDCLLHHPARVETNSFHYTAKVSWQPFWVETSLAPVAAFKGH